jgi:hypothetical protein
MSLAKPTTVVKVVICRVGKIQGSDSSVKFNVHWPMILVTIRGTGTTIAASVFR